MNGEKQAFTTTKLFVLYFRVQAQRTYRGLAFDFSVRVLTHPDPLDLMERCRFVSSPREGK